MSEVPVAAATSWAVYPDERFDDRTYLLVLEDDEGAPIAVVPYSYERWKTVMKNLDKVTREGTQ